MLAYRTVSLEMLLISLLDEKEINYHSVAMSTEAVSNPTKKHTFNNNTLFILV